MTFTIFAGTTGFDKSIYLHKFRDECLRRNHYQPESGEADRFIKYVKFEEHLIQTAHCSDINAFLKIPSSQTKFEHIERTFQKIADELEHSRPRNIFFDIHLSYYRNSTFLPPFAKTNFESIINAAEDPSVQVITLIDDIFIIWKNLKRKLGEYPNTDLRLREIVSWRSLEILQSETVALNLTTDVRSVTAFLIAIRHPVDTLYNSCVPAKSTYRILVLSYYQNEKNPSRLARHK